MEIAYPAPSGKILRPAVDEATVTPIMNSRVLLQFVFSLSRTSSELDFERDSELVEMTDCNSVFSSSSCEILISWRSIV